MSTNLMSTTQTSIAQQTLNSDKPHRSYHWVVLADEHRTSRVSSAVNGQQPGESRLNKRRATGPADWKPPAGQVEQRLLRSAWSQQRDQPVRGLMWCPAAKPAPQPGRWLDRDCNAALNMQRIGEEQVAHAGVVLLARAGEDASHGQRLTISTCFSCQLYTIPSRPGTSVDGRHSCTMCIGYTPHSPLTPSESGHYCPLLATNQLTMKAVSRVGDK
ncbi:hypothetical protein HaLaN_10909 [Haematococcus lacustris]|uniref:Uncharacterized protein n=1 Tax=Haematococcus lacustris TaxID=44745 RepID=A0A699YX20_HAELA|nr:hypothetical protein HaLaN_10909 [Haematococcus lacustris]